jgi:hypothetical protein
LPLLALVLWLGAGSFGCGDSQTPAGSAADPKSATAAGQLPSNSDEALGPTEKPFNGQLGVRFSIRPPEGYKPDSISKRGYFQWRGKAWRNNGKHVLNNVLRVRIEVALPDATAESEMARETARMGQEEYTGFKAGSPIKSSIGAGRPVEFLRTDFTFADKILYNKAAEFGPGSGFLYTAVIDGNTIYIDSDEVDGGPGKLGVADAAARSFVVLSSIRTINLAGATKSAVPPIVDRAHDPLYKNIPDNKPVMHRAEAGDPGPDGWCVAASTRGSFSVSLPGKFSDSMIKSRTRTGGIGVMHTIARKTNDGAEFSVLETEVIGERPKPQNDSVQQMIDGYQKKGVQVKRSETTIAGERADRLSLNAKGVSAEIVLVTIADREYMLAVQWRPPAHQGMADDIERFFASFKVKPKPEGEQSQSR